MGVDSVHTNCALKNFPRYTIYRSLYGSGVSLVIGSVSRALVDENRASYSSILKASPQAIEQTLDS